MGETTAISVRMDKDLKKQADALFTELGMTMSTAINVFVRQAVRDGKIPFEISHERFNAEVEEAFEEADRILANPSLYKSYTDVDEMFKELLAECTQ